MSRIRSIHPGIWTDEAFVALSPYARLLFIGMWNECDDKGTFAWSPLKLKMRVLPADNIDVGALLAEIEAQGFIARYDFAGRPFGAVRNFCRHQRPKKPNDIHPASADMLRFAGMDEELIAEKAKIVPNQFPTSGEKTPQMEDGGESSSEANASGGSPPSLSAADMTKAVWEAGKTILKAAGHDDRSAGSIIGRFRKTYSDSQVLVALSRCQTEQPSDPVGWLTKTLQAEARKASGGTDGKRAFDQRATTRQTGERVAARYAAAGSGAAHLLSGPGPSRGDV